MANEVRHPERVLFYWMAIFCLNFLTIAFVLPAHGLIREGGDGTEEVLVGAAQPELYFPFLEGKRVAFAGNHTAVVEGKHLVDILVEEGVDVVKIFSPEHGFRGTAAHGEWVDSGIDRETGLPVISLYGASRRPTEAQLSDVDVILFDIQDVGVRFYTYISTMTYFLEEVARHGKKMVVLDRPNPLGHYVDGPVLEPGHSSFVGLHAIPIVHGMTIGEYALMVNGEGWLADGLVCDLVVIPMGRYGHTSRYHLPLAPSPNLPDMHSVYLYPSLCLFEGTDISLGRGTDKPFQVFGHPGLPPATFPYTFTPGRVAAAPNPPQLEKLCHGRDLSTIPLKELEKKTQINLGYILEAYRYFPDKDRFFNSFFERLSGTTRLREQIVAGWSEQQIRESWQPGIEAFKVIRSRYLLYEDTSKAAGNK